MKHKFLILFLLFISCKSQISNSSEDYDKTNYVGIGLLEIGFKNSLKIYKKENSKNYFDEIIFDDNAKKFKSLFNTKIIEGKLNSYSYMEEIKSPLFFTVLDISKSYYKLLLNETSKEIGFVKIDEVTENRHNYITWEYKLKNALKIVLTNTDVYESVNGKKINQIGNQSCYFKIIQVENEWAKILFINEVDNQQAKDKNGWIKWRNNKTILIRIIKGIYY